MQPFSLTYSASTLQNPLGPLQGKLDWGINIMIIIIIIIMIIVIINVITIIIIIICIIIIIIIISRSSVFIFGKVGLE